MTTKLKEKSRTKLIRDEGQRRTHYKMYKAGKHWAYVGISIFTFGVGVLISNTTIYAAATTSNSGADTSATSTSEALQDQKSVTLAESTPASSDTASATADSTGTTDASDSSDEDSTTDNGTVASPVTNETKTDTNSNDSTLSSNEVTGSSSVSQTNAPTETPASSAVEKNGSTTPSTDTQNNGETTTSETTSLKTDTDNPGSGSTEKESTENESAQNENEQAESTETDDTSSNATILAASGSFSDETAGTLRTNSDSEAGQVASILAELPTGTSAQTLADGTISFSLPAGISADTLTQAKTILAGSDLKKIQITAVQAETVSDSTVTQTVAMTLNQAILANYTPTMSAADFLKMDIENYSDATGTNGSYSWLNWNNTAISTYFADDRATEKAAFISDLTNMASDDNFSNYFTVTNDGTNAGGYSYALTAAGVAALNSSLATTTNNAYQVSFASGANTGNLYIQFQMTITPVSKVYDGDPVTDDLNSLVTKMRYYNPNETEKTVMSNYTLPMPFFQLGDFTGTTGDAAVGTYTRDLARGNDIGLDYINLKFIDELSDAINPKPDFSYVKATYTITKRAATVTPVITAVSTSGVPTVSLSYTVSDASTLTANAVLPTAITLSADDYTVSNANNVMTVTLTDDGITAINTANPNYNITAVTGTAATATTTIQYVDEDENNIVLSQATKMLTGLASDTSTAIYTPSMAWDTGGLYKLADDQATTIQYQPGKTQTLQIKVAHYTEQVTVSVMDTNGNQLRADQIVTLNPASDVDGISTINVSVDGYSTSQLSSATITYAGNEHNKSGNGKATFTVDKNAKTIDMVVTDLNGTQTYEYEMSGVTPDYLTQIIGGAGNLLDFGTASTIGQYAETNFLSYASINVTYFAKASAQVTYVDDDTKDAAGNSLLLSSLTQTVTGYDDGPAQTVALAIPDGYVLADTQGNNIDVVDNVAYYTGTLISTGDSDNGVVHLKHATTAYDTPKSDADIPADITNKSDVEKTITRTITYTLADGSLAAATHTDAVTYARSFTYDDITDTAVSFGDWEVVDGHAYFNQITTPDVAGYTANETQIAATTVTADTASATIAVTYTPNTDTAVNITFFDDTDNLALPSANDFSLYGTTATTLDHEAVTLPANYILASIQSDSKISASNGVAYYSGVVSAGSADDAVVHLVHQTADIDPTTVQDIPGAIQNLSAVEKTVTRTIDYVTTDGSQASAAKTDTVTFVASFTYDYVTNLASNISAFKVLGTDDTSVDLSAFLTPTMPGYTADVLQISAAGITADSDSTNQTVTYTPNTDTTATVSFYDGTSKAPLASGNNVVLSGTTGQQVATNNVITIPTGYVLDADTLSNNVTLDDGVVTYTGKLSADNSDDAVIYLNHATVNYDPTQGEAIPAGLMNVTDVEKTTTRTITYTFSNGVAAGATHTDTVTYARAFAYDEVTKTATATGDWQVISGTADFLAVYSPLAAGYHLQDSNQSIISEETIGSDADAKNETIDVIYEPNTDTPATITFFDDTTGQALAEETSLTSRGTTGEQASVTIVIPQNYALGTQTDSNIKVIDGVPTYVGTYSTNTSDDATVHLIHATTSIAVTDSLPTDLQNTNDVSKTVTRTIIYTLADGTTMAPAKTDSATLQRSFTYDLVTKTASEFGEWTVTSGEVTFDEVTSPEVAGYSLSDSNQATIGSETITGDSVSGTINVSYVPNNDTTAIISFYDDTTDNYLPKDDNLTVTGTTGTSGTIDQTASDTINIPTGYQIVDSSANTNVLISNGVATYTGALSADETDNAVLHLTHMTVPQAAPENTADLPTNLTNPTDVIRTITRTITYSLQNGTTAAPTRTDTLTFSRSYDLDEVTNTAVNLGAWVLVDSNAAQFGDVISPTIAGYTLTDASQATVAGNSAVTADTADSTVNVSYTADVHTPITISFFDDDSDVALTTKTTITGTTDNIAILAGIKIPDDYNYAATQTSSYVSLAADGSVTYQGSYFANGGGDAVIHLTHQSVVVDPTSTDGTLPDALTNVADVKSTVTQTINYQNASGQTMADSNTQSVTFERSFTYDLVTHTASEFGDWTAIKGTANFTAVDSPNIAGYTAATTSVSEVTVVAGTPDVDITVYYLGNTDTKATISFYDETSKVALPTNFDITKVGTTDQGANDTSITIPTGYRLVPDQNGTKLSVSADGTTATYTGTMAADNSDDLVVYLVHDDQQIQVTSLNDLPTDLANPETVEKTVTRTITYTTPNTVTTPETQVDSITFVAPSFTYDPITKLASDISDIGSWFAIGNAEFSAVTVPTLTGYTPTITNLTNSDTALNQIPAISVTAGTDNLNYEVSYQADSQTATVSFYDDTEGKTLADSYNIEKSGKTGETATDASITIPAGYTLSTKQTGPNISPLAGGGVVYSGTLSPNGSDDAVVHLIHLTQQFTPKSNTDIPTGITNLTDVERTITRTITYTLPSGLSAAPTVTQALSYLRDFTYDYVTNTASNLGTWREVDNATGFDSVGSPSVSGYSLADANQTMINTITVSDPTTVASAHQTINVDYVADTVSATIRFYDDTDDVFLPTDQNQILEGQTAQVGQADTINVPAGYQLDTTHLDNNIDADGTYSGTFSPDNSDDAIVYLVHKTESFEANQTLPIGLVNKDDVEKTFTRVITYTLPDGTEAAAPHSDTVTFTRSFTYDEVTNEAFDYGDWVDSNGSATATLDAVTPPTINGYVLAANSPVASLQTIQADSFSDAQYIETIAVIYDATTQTATITFYDDTTGTQLTNETTTTGDMGTKGSSIISIPSGYTLAAFQPNSNVTVQDGVVRYTGTFSTSKLDDAVVHLVHQTISVDPLAVNALPADLINTNDVKRTVTQTINYALNDSGTSTVLAPADTQSVTFVRSFTYDLVTHLATATGEWTAISGADSSYTSVTSPVLPGYTLNDAAQSTIAGSSVTAEADNNVITVRYNADQNTPLTVTYYDDTSKIALAGNFDSIATGTTGTQTTITDFVIPAGYLVAEGQSDSHITKSSNTTFTYKGVFSGEDSGNAVVHLIHNTYTVDPNGDLTTLPTGLINQSEVQKTVTRTIAYVLPNGTPAATTHTDSATFTRSFTYDAVTGVASQFGEWEPAGGIVFENVDDPTISGYSVKKNTDGTSGTTQTVTVKSDTQNWSVLVTYQADPASATVYFFDDTTGQELSDTVTLNGVTGETPDGNTIALPTGLSGYLFADNSAQTNPNIQIKNGQAIYSGILTADDKDNAVIHVVHNIGTIVPDRSGDNIPSAMTNLNDVRQTVTRTIVYETVTGVAAPAVKTDSVTFQAESFDYDYATNKAINIKGLTALADDSADWTTKDNGQSITFNTVINPTVAGYYATPAQADAVTDVTADSADIVQLIRYNQPYTIDRDGGKTVFTLDQNGDITDVTKTWPDGDQTQISIDQTSGDLTVTETPSGQVSLTPVTLTNDGGQNSVSVGNTTVVSQQPMGFALTHDSETSQATGIVGEIVTTAPGSSAGTITYTKPTVTAADGSITNVAVDGEGKVTTIDKTWADGDKTHLVIDSSGNIIFTETPADGEAPITKAIQWHKSDATYRTAVDSTEDGIVLTHTNNNSSVVARENISVEGAVTQLPITGNNTGISGGNGSATDVLGTTGSSTGTKSPTTNAGSQTASDKKPTNKKPGEQTSGNVKQGTNKKTQRQKTPDAQTGRSRNGQPLSLTYQTGNPDYQASNTTGVKAALKGKTIQKTERSKPKSKTTLPQTSESTSNKTGALGLLGAILGFFGLAAEARRKKRE